MIINSGKLVVSMGQTIEGETRYANISEFPHCLIAGTTGSGKTVLINALLLSLLQKNSPEDLQLILIDPKKIGLLSYKGLPQLHKNEKKRKYSLISNT